MPKVILGIRAERDFEWKVSISLFFQQSMQVFSTFTSQVPGIPNEASRKNKIIVKNVTLWKRSGDNSVVAGVFFNSIMYQVAFLFPTVIHHAISSDEWSRHFTSKSLIHYISLSHSVGNNQNTTEQDRFLWERICGCILQ